MKTLYFLLLNLVFSFTSFGQTTIFQESFETGNSGITTEDCNDGTNFFTRTDGLDVTSEITGVDGTFFFAAQDTDHDACTMDVQTLTFTAIDISGNSEMTFAVLVAEDDAADNNEDWDANTNVVFEINIDDTGYTNLIQFSGGGTTNTEPGLDTDFDGIADSNSLTSIFQEFTTAISGTGSSADIRVTFNNLDASDEDIAIDNFRIIEGFPVTPIISVGTAISGLDYFEGNGPSAESTFQVSGTNLTDDLTITAPTNFEISLTTGTSFGSSVTVPPSMGTVYPITVFVRLIAGLTSNSYAGDVMVSSTGATNQTITVNGVVSATDPQFTISGSIEDLTYFEGFGPSEEDSFNISGLFLTGDITITAPINFEISLTAGTGFGSSVIVPPNMGTVDNIEIFVRLAAGLSINSYLGDITISTTDASSQTISVTGNIFQTAVCSNAGDIIITEIMQNPSANADPNGEYFELYNTTASPIDIANWVIKGAITASEIHIITSSVIVPPMGYIVIGNEATPNGGTTFDYTYANDISLSNSTDGIIIECNSAVIDQVIWDNGATFPDPNGASMELSITSLNNTDNDDGTNWAEAVTPFGSGDLGTPGDENDNAGTLSINSFDEESVDFIIFPNPTSTGIVNITTKPTTDVQILVFDILGKQVISETLSNNRLDVSMLNIGIYILKLNKDTTSVTRKLVIE